jgi:hypothetical protein
MREYVNRLWTIDQACFFCGSAFQIHQARKRHSPIGTVDGLHFDRAGCINYLFQFRKAGRPFWSAISEKILGRSSRNGVESFRYIKVMP